MNDLTFLKGSADWWRQATVYQIYPRSFADANGDGIGDLRGITSKIDYLASLNIDAVWLSPFYPSALADGGYDVDDYRNVDPRIGTLEEFDEMVQKLHAVGIRVIVDIVPNHSGSNHVWFQEALRSPKGSPARDRYIFRDGRGENGEIRPSELASHFGPTAWTRITEPDGTPGQWYMHLFAKEQPDFNWNNPEVREDFLKTLKFWSDRGVDGYRIDVAHALTKQLDPLPERTSFDLSVMKDDGTDTLFDRDEVHDIYRSWRGVFNQYEPPRMAVAEAWVHPNRRAPYASTSELGQSFNFDMLGAGWNIGNVKKIAKYNLGEAAKQGSSTTWVLSNHDVIRHATRLMIPTQHDVAGWFKNHRFNHKLDLDLGVKRAKAMTMALLGLPGSTYLYQGEELGLHEHLHIADEDMQDPQFFRNPELGLSRDGCRVPLPWNRFEPGFGFGSDKPHLPQPAWYESVAVDAQDGNPNSTLTFYRNALKLRRELLVADENWKIHNHLLRPDVFHFSRSNGWHSITNFGSKPFKLPAGKVVLSSEPLVDGKLAPDSTVWIRA